MPMEICISDIEKDMIIFHLKRLNIYADGDLSSTAKHPFRISHDMKDMIIFHKRRPRVNADGELSNTVKHPFGIYHHL